MDDKIERDIQKSTGRYLLVAWNCAQQGLAFPTLMPTKPTPMPTIRVRDRDEAERRIKKTPSRKEENECSFEQNPKILSTEINLTKNGDNEQEDVECFGENTTDINSID